MYLLLVLNTMWLVSVNMPLLLSAVTQMLVLLAAEELSPFDWNSSVSIHIHKVAAQYLQNNGPGVLLLAANELSKLHNSESGEHDNVPIELTFIHPAVYLCVTWNISGPKPGQGGVALTPWVRVSDCWCYLQITIQQWLIVSKNIGISTKGLKQTPGTVIDHGMFLWCMLHVCYFGPCPCCSGLALHTVSISPQ